MIIGLGLKPATLRLRDATNPNIIGPTTLGVVSSVWTQVAQVKANIQMKLHCCFARDVTAAMLVITNKIVYLLWELKAIFM